MHADCDVDGKQVKKNMKREVYTVKCRETKFIQDKVRTIPAKPMLSL